jgi:transcriptional regulator with XRE-family HTH domain
VSEISELLKKLRGKDSLREASKKTGISHNYISIIEKGVDPRTGSPVNVTPETLKSYSKGYHYDYETLMIVAGHIEAKKEEKGFLTDPQKLKIYELIVELDEDNKNYVMETIKRITKK